MTRVSLAALLAGIPYLLVSPSFGAEGLSRTATVCESPRPQVCTMDYAPVCGLRSDQTTKTYSNGCSACSDPEVTGFLQGACEHDAGHEK